MPPTPLASFNKQLPAIPSTRAVSHTRAELGDRHPSACLDGTGTEWGQVWRSPSSLCTLLYSWPLLALPSQPP